MRVATSPACRRPRAPAPPVLACLAAVLTLALLPALAAPAAAGVPPGYYDGVDASTPQQLRATLHDLIDDHLRIPYDDTWEPLERADEYPGHPDRVLDVYHNVSYRKVADRDTPQSDGYQREHVWPNSYGFPKQSLTPYSDCHALFLVDGRYNGSRSNLPYGFCNAGCLQKETMAENGRGGMEMAVYPGDSNWRSGSGASGTWETWLGRRGDVARALFYMDVRYEGGVDGSGHEEPDLALTDDVSRVVSSPDPQPVAYMARLSDLLVWHVQDPVDAAERARNDAVYLYQGNRNPFVDHPEWVYALFAAGEMPAELALRDGRFRVRVRWRTSQGTEGQGQPQPLTPDTGYFWFFRPSNVEMMIKVLDGCAVNDRFWVFAAGLTNVEVEITVEDRQEQQTHTYRNELDHDFVPVLDTGAFATCGGPPEPPGSCTPPSQCCKICGIGSSRACGDSCISLDKTCHQAPGCACDEADVCSL